MSLNARSVMMTTISMPELVIRAYNNDTKVPKTGAGSVLRPCFAKVSRRPPGGQTTDSSRFLRVWLFHYSYHPLTRSPVAGSLKLPSRSMREVASLSTPVTSHDASPPTARVSKAPCTPGTGRKPPDTGEDNPGHHPGRTNPRSRGTHFQRGQRSIRTPGSKRQV